MKIKNTKIKKILLHKRIQRHVVVIVITLVMGMLTGSALVASKVYAMQIDDELATQQAALDKKLMGMKKSKKSTGKVASANTVKAAESGSNATPTLSKPAPAPAQSLKPAAPAAPKASNRPAKSAPKPAAPSVPPVQTSGLETTSSLSYINSVRASAGKTGLTQNATMNQWALAHTQTLAASCQLYHQSLSPFLNKNIGQTIVRSIAENIGYASSTPAVLDALKNSPGHYANMTGDYQYVGIGVIKAGSGTCSGQVYTTQLFAK